MTDETQECPKCNSPYAYPDAQLWVCPECFHEWSVDTSLEEAPKFICANGNQLHDGDSVTTIKDLKAGNGTIKVGSKAKNIKLLNDPIDGHDISCKIDGHGSVYLKCSVVKKNN